jgi:rubrerythrin
VTPEQARERLAERGHCEENHRPQGVPHNGFGWTGWRCPQCGFMFFGEWEPGFGPSSYRIDSGGAD